MTGRMIRDCGADDVAGNRLAFRKRRFEMIAALVMRLSVDWPVNWNEPE
jgi:hypothetical protein